MSEQGNKMVPIEPTKSFWDDFFLVYNLVVVGTREKSGEYDLAAKHMAMPLGWENYYGFVCTPRHNTFHNAAREGAFTVSFPRPSQVILASLTASGRGANDSKDSLRALSTFPARRVNGVLLEDAYLHFECEFDRVVEGFGEWGLIVGRVVLAHVSEDALRSPDSDDADLIYRSPLLAYLSPGRIASIADTNAFPFHVDFHR